MNKRAKHAPIIHRRFSALRDRAVYESEQIIRSLSYSLAAISIGDYISGRNTVRRSKIGQRRWMRQAIGLNRGRAPSRALREIKSDS